MSYTFVVARYNENIEWLRDEMDHTILYNKGSPLNLKNEIMLENVGRESDTYLHYIITHYDELPDVVVFTQARISDHKGRDDVNYLRHIKHEALHKKKSQNFMLHHETPYHTCCWDKEWNLIHGNYYLQDNYKNNQPITFIEWFKKNINPSYPNPIYIYCNAIFAVRKECILNKPVEYYQQLRSEVNHHDNSAEGHFFERSWYYIFE
jgi:hypothetical protein